MLRHMHMVSSFLSRCHCREKSYIKCDKDKHLHIDELVLQLLVKDLTATTHVLILLSKELMFSFFGLY
jgi:hypothetical protein